MTKLKTQKNQKSVKAFLNSISNSQQQNDCKAILELMRSISHSTPHMWGSNIIGFGSYHYIYASGREGDWFLTGFSPRKHNISIYIMPGFSDHIDLLNKLGKHKTGKSCLYIKSLEDIHLPTLKTLIRRSIQQMRKIYPNSSL